MVMMQIADLIHENFKSSHEVAPKRLESRLTH